MRQYRTSFYSLSMVAWLAVCALCVWELIQSIIMVIRHPGDWFFLLIMIPVYFWVPASIFRMFHDYRLVISESGIKYENIRYTIYSDWKDIKRKQSFLWQVQLVLENPVIEKRKDWCLWMDFRRPSNLIPIGPSTWEKYDEVETELRKRAPRLFQV